MRIGIDVGGSFIKAAAVSGDLKTYARREFFYPKGANKEELCRLLAQTAIQIARACGKEKPDSLGVALPGILNARRDTLVSACNIKLFDAEIKQELENLLSGTNISLINDADAAAVAEKAGGVFKDKQCALLLTLGTGVGSGMILNGKLFYDRHGQGAELGHMPVFKGGEQCACGRHGCIQTLCSASWLSKEGKDALEKDKDGLIFKTAAGDPKKVGAKTVIECARLGDKTANQIFERYLDSLSHAVSCLFAFIDFEVIAIGGGVSLAGDFLFAPLIKKVEEKLMRKCNIVPAFLKNDAGIIGAAFAQDYTQENQDMID